MTRFYIKTLTDSEKPGLVVPKLLTFGHKLTAGDKIYYKPGAYAFALCASIIEDDNGLNLVKEDTPDSDFPMPPLPKKERKELEEIIDYIKAAGQQEGKNEPMEGAVDELADLPASVDDYKLFRLKEYAGKTTGSTWLPGSAANAIKDVINRHHRSPELVFLRVEDIASKKFIKKQDDTLQKAKFPGFFKSVSSKSPEENVDGAIMYYATLKDIAASKTLKEVDEATDLRDAAMRKTEEMKGPGNK